MTTATTTCTLTCLLAALGLCACDGAKGGAGATATATPTSTATATPTSTATSATPETAHDAEAREGDEAEHGPHYGALMAEIGRRFELAGRAAEARRYALAAFEIEEMQEVFGEDLPRAAPPRQGDPKKLAVLTNELHEQQLVALAKAADDSDADAFAKTFALAAQTCNACHQATEHAFVEIPEQPGKEVPRLDPLPP